MRKRTVELVGFYNPEDISKGGNITAIQTQYLPTGTELIELASKKMLRKYKVILVDKEEDDKLQINGFEFFDRKSLLTSLRDVDDIEKQINYED
jgi:hypothetical protein